MVVMNDVHKRIAVCDLAQRWYDELEDYTQTTRIWLYSDDVQDVLHRLHDLLFKPDSTVVHEVIMAWVTDWLKLRTECRAEFEEAESDGIPTSVMRKLRKLPIFNYDMLAVYWLIDRQSKCGEPEPCAANLMARETSKSPYVQRATQTALGGVWLRAMRNDQAFVITTLEKLMRSKAAVCEEGAANDARD